MLDLFSSLLLINPPEKRAPADIILHSPWFPCHGINDLWTAIDHMKSFLKKQ
jgi:hypothetical protein